MARYDGLRCLPNLTKDFNVTSHLATYTRLLVHPAESASLNHELSLCFESSISCHACASNAGLDH